MKYKILKFEFHTSVHFGNGGLEKSKNTLSSDTIFSALFIEAVKYKKADEFLKLFKEKGMRLSSAFPYIDKEYYIPKPMISLNKEDEGDSVIKKAFKKLKYIPLSKFDLFINGKLDVKAEEENFRKNFGKFSLIEKVSVLDLKEGEESRLYALETFTYKKESGLYIFVSYEKDDDFKLLREMFESLSYTGIGGKVSAGYGKFKLREDVPDENISKYFIDIKKFKKFMSLSICLPKEDEIERKLENASYSVVKRSGFIASDTYSNTFRKKRDFYMLEAGSVYENEFVGDIYDISEKDFGSHAVYRYGLPFFMGVVKWKAI